ncbi:MAG: hypothetical protein KGP28_12240, partial [Bdellovibrionales bacterium]|nr:hypothetical protein [Bdellovibrionales bacterium]
MNQFRSGILGAICLILTLGAGAQAQVAPTPSKTKASSPNLRNSAPPAPIIPAPVVTAKKEEDRKFYQNLRMAYFLDYDGPRFTNFDLTQSQGPLDETSSFATIFHTFRVGYAVSPRVTILFQLGGTASLDPQQPFTLGDLSNIVNWSKMVETDDLEIQGVLRLTYPTTAASVAAGKLFAVRAQGNWTFKTPLRNWSFTTATKFTSSFFKSPTGSTSDFVVELAPYITVDLSPNVQWLFEGSFDANHQYADTSFDFRQGDPDSFDTGPIFTINSHASITTTIKFYTSRISFD